MSYVQVEPAPGVV